MTHWGLGRSGLWGKKLLLFCVVLVSVAEAIGDTSHAHATFTVSAPHMYYTCPHGATVKLLCAQSGALMHPNGHLRYNWLFTPHSDKHCKDRVGPRNINSHTHTVPPGVRFGATEENFWVILENVTHADQGRYCCLVLDIQVTNHHGTVQQQHHSHVVLTITPQRNGSQECTIVDPNLPGGSAAVALAVAACVLALLSLPLILVLVYKQRQSAESSGRAQELVRMDSENPVFLGGSPQVKTRTVSQIMTRQSSETGRHLLSEPGTPLSPAGPGDVFFPAEDPIPESPDSL